jgi:hypothetical protein
MSGFSTFRAPIAMAALAAALIAAPHDASANTVRYYAGHECQPLNEDVSSVDYWSEGCVNETETCADTATVWLPISGRNGFDIDFDSAGLYFFDGSTGGSVSCIIVVFNTSGTSYISAVEGSAVPGTGSGALSWTGTEPPNAGANIANVGNASIQCTLPAKKPSGTCTTQSVSVIKSYTVDTVGP